LSQTGTVADDEGALTAMDTFERSQFLHASAPPGVKSRCRPLGDTIPKVPHAAGGIPEAWRCYTPQ
jgi:hypothetical protein